MSKHTAGPWVATVKPVGDCLYSFGDNDPCQGGHPCYSEFVEPLHIQMHGKGFDMSCATARDGVPPSSADARLIAAAPDLLAALKLYRLRCSGWTIESAAGENSLGIPRDPNGANGWDVAQDLADEAIAKAEEP